VMKALIEGVKLVDISLVVCIQPRSEVLEGAWALPLIKTQGEATETYSAQTLQSDR
jgi:hypothetical protein